MTIYICNPIYIAIFHTCYYAIDFIYTCICWKPIKLFWHLLIYSNPLIINFGSCSYYSILNKYIHVSFTLVPIDLFCKERTLVGQESYSLHQHVRKRNGQIFFKFMFQHASVSRSQVIMIRVGHLCN